MINYQLVVLCVISVIAIPRVIDHVALLVHRAPFTSNYSGANHIIGWISFACCLYFFMNGGTFL